MRTLTKLKSAGFTLVEVIITLVVAAIVGTMLFSVLGSSMTKSSLPITRLQTSFALQQIMENIKASYPKYYAFDLPGLQTAIGGAVIGGNVPQDNSYGKYTLVDNYFIKFVANQEQPGTASDNLLKVTIKNSNNETLTSVFIQ